MTLLFQQEQLLELHPLHQLMIHCMKISETAIIDIVVSGGGASESGTQQLTLTITDEALDSGTQATYNSSNETIFFTSTEFTNIEAMSSSASSDPSPWESINLHKALGIWKIWR